jgi:2-iminobutanoate/2-iminopropanoate deaminase
MRDAIATPAAPRAAGPYSQAVRAGGFVFVSGQIAIDPSTGTLVDGDIEAQTRRVMTNVSEILAAAGASLDQVVRTTVFLASLDDFAVMNKVYGEFFSQPAPARSTIEASRLPARAKVEIDAIAWLGP